MPARWNEETTVKFVKLYKENECLWNVSSSQYKNKQIREHALMQMVDEMGVPGFGLGEARNKIKNLRTTYTQELTKIEKSRADCKIEDCVYVPALKWFDIMDSCIRDFLIRKSVTANLDEAPIDDSIFIKEEEPFETIFESFSREDDSNQFQEEVCLPKPKRPKISEITTTVVEVPAIKRNPKPNPSKESEFEVFGKHISMQLSKLSTKQFILAQQEIQAVITRHRLKDYQEQRSLSPNSFDFNDDVNI